MYSSNNSETTQNIAHAPSSVTDLHDMLEYVSFDITHRHHVANADPICNLQSVWRQTITDAVASRQKHTRAQTMFSPTHTNSLNTQTFLHMHTIAHTQPHTSLVWIALCSTIFRSDSRTPSAAPSCHPRDRLISHPLANIRIHSLCLDLTKSCM